MDRGDLETSKLEMDLATTPEKRAAWFERWSRELVREVEDWMSGEKSLHDEYEY